MTHTSPSDTGCGITVLRTVGDARATKRWRWDAKGQEWSKISYEAGAWFVPRQHQVANLAELVTVLDQVRRDPRAFVVRGALTPEVVEALASDPGHLIRRRKHLKQGIDPSLLEVPRRWVMIDIDNWPLPSWGDLVDDPDTAIDTAIYELLPEPFHDAECWWQLSSSAGFAHGYLKAHLFFWLSASATNTHIKAVLKQHAPGVDRAPFSAAQPHYIADPLIEGGHDPLARRTGWRRGIEMEVALPELRVEAPSPRATGAGAAGRVGGIDDALAFLGHGEGGDGFHAPLRTATLRYAQQCQRHNERDDEGLKTTLRDAIRSAPCRPGGNVETPYCQDYYLDSLIEGAFALLAGDDEIQTMRPHHAAPKDSVNDARAALANHVGGFMERAIGWHRLGGSAQGEQPPEHAALVVDVGVGKSRAAREALAGFIAGAKGEDRTREQQVLEGRAPHRVLWLVPTHKLGNETLEAMQGLGLNAAVMRGREADEPGTADLENDEPAQKMCLNIPAVEDAMAAGYDAETAACGTGKDGSPSCPYRSQCAYQRQKKTVAQADVVIASHQALFHQLPKEVARGLGLVVADEAWWQAGLQPNRVTRLAAFAEEPLQYPVLQKDKVSAKSFRYSTHEMATNDLHTLSRKAQAAFSTIEDGGFVSRNAMMDAELTADDCAEAIKLEWRRRREGAVWPGMSLDARAQGVQVAAGNLSIPRRAAVWEAMRELLVGSESHTGRLQVGSRSDKEGPYRAILLHTRDKVRDDVAELPMLHLDATMPVQVVRHYLPNLTVLAEVKAEAPHMQVHQVIGGWGKTSIVPHEKAAPEENRRRENLVAELTDFVRLNSGGNALAITYEAIESRFAGLPGVRTGHFNAIAGLDSFGDVRSLFVIGRPLADARQLRDDALALTGRPILPEAGRVETRGALMADGTGAALNVRTYANPDLEALRVAVTDAEVVQAIGRGRGINRTASTPLAVFVMADVVLPLPVNQLGRWGDLRPDVMSRMHARGAVLRSAADAAKAYPDLFPTPEAARKAMQRSGGGKGDFPDIPLRESILGECPGNRLLEVVYRPTGRGQQQRSAKVALWHVGSFREWLETLLGSLLVYEVANDPPPSPSARQDVPRPQPPEPPAAPMPVWDDDPGWRPADLERLMAAPDHLDPQAHILDLERDAMPEMQMTDREQPGLDPALIYRPTVLKPIKPDEQCIAIKPGPHIQMRERLGVQTAAPGSRLLRGLGVIDHSAASIPPGQVFDVCMQWPEPGD